MNTFAHLLEGLSGKSILSEVKRLEAKVKKFKAEQARIPGLVKSTAAELKEVDESDEEARTEINARLEKLKARLPWLEKAIALREEKIEAFRNAHSVTVDPGAQADALKGALAAIADLRKQLAELTKPKKSAPEKEPAPESK